MADEAHLIFIHLGCEVFSGADLCEAESGRLSFKSGTEVANLRLTAKKAGKKDLRNAKYVAKSIEV